MRVLVPLADGVEDLEAVTLIDVLRRGSIDVVSVSISDSQTVQGARGVRLIADACWTAITPDAFDALVLPGGGKGTEALANDNRVVEAVIAFNAAGKTVAALCAAPTILATAGILKGRRATCYPTCGDALGEAYDDAPVIADGNIITSQGPGTAMLFALVLVQHLAGEPVARHVADGLLTSF